MRTKIANFLGIFMMSAMLLIGIAAIFTPAPATDRYTSEWVLVQAGEIHNFEHGLGVRPMIVQAWAALHVARNFNEAIPLYQTDVIIQTVNPSVVSVHNVSGTDWMVQVVAEK